MSTLLTDRAFLELKREVRQLRSQLSNRKSLSRVGVRRHEAVWMPAGSTELLTYQCYDLEGFSGSGSNAVLKTGNLVGWLGAVYAFGSESSVGFDHDGDETTPSTNGNWECTNTGLFYVDLQGTFDFQFGSSWTTSRTPYIEIQLWEKQPSLSIRRYQDSSGATRQYYGQAFQFETEASTISMHYNTGLTVFVEEGTRLAWRIQLFNQGEVEADFFASKAPFFNIWRIGDSDQTRTDVF